MVGEATGKLRLTLIGLLFVGVVLAIASYTHQLIVPLFLGLLTWGKAWLKTLSPKLGLLLVKNGTAIQARRLAMQTSTHLFVKSHRPWRRWLTQVRLFLSDKLKAVFERYMSYPLWLRSAVAIGILLTTAGSTFAMIALLIIPQPVLDWLRSQIVNMLNKLGATRFFATLWRTLIPAKLRHRWHMYVKWEVGRKQVMAAKKLHSSVIKRP